MPFSLKNFLSILRFFFILFSVLVSAIFALFRNFSYGVSLVHIPCGSKRGEFLIAAFPKSGIRRGMLCAVYLFLLVVFMGVIFADSVSAATLANNIGTFASTSAVLQGGSGVAQQFTTGSHSLGYNLDHVALWIRESGDDADVSISIYNSSSDEPDVKLYDLSGSWDRG